MKSFEYAQPTTEAEALELLSPELGKTELLAGGADLVGLLKKMILTPDRVVNISDVETIQCIQRDPPTGEIWVGAAVHLDDALVHPLLSEYPAIHKAIDGIASLQLQAQGTLVGELCRRPQCWYFRDGYGLLADAGRRVEEGDSRYHAILGNQGAAKFVSASRIAPALISLGAEVRVIGPATSGEYIIPLIDLYQTPKHEGQRETTLLPNQIVSHVILKPLAGRSCASYEVRQGAGPDAPLASAAATLTIKDGLVRDASIVLGQVAPTPWVSPEAAKSIIGHRVNEKTAQAAGVAALRRATPLAKNEYKVQLAEVAIRRAILRAAGIDVGGF